MPSSEDAKRRLLEKAKKRDQKAKPKMRMSGKGLKRFASRKKEE